MQYKLAILLFKVINSETTSWDFISLFFNQNFNERNPYINFRDTSHYKIGKNILANRLPVLNNKIDTLWLNQSLSSYKIKCKNSFLWTIIEVVFTLCNINQHRKLSKFKVEPKSKAAGEYKHVVNWLIDAQECKNKYYKMIVSKAQ